MKLKELKINTETDKKKIRFVKQTRRLKKRGETGGRESKEGKSFTKGQLC